MIRSWQRYSLITHLVVAAVFTVVAQGPPLRRHIATGKRPLNLIAADQQPPSTNRVSIEIDHGHRHVAANGIPDHKVGPFPNSTNPHAIRPQQYRIDLPATPQPADKITSIYLSGRRGPPNMPFGITVTGVLMDPGTAEFWQGDQEANWNYEALSGYATFVSNIAWIGSRLWSRKKL